MIEATGSVLLVFSAVFYPASGQSETFIVGVVHDGSRADVAHLFNATAPWWAMGGREIELDLFIATGSKVAVEDQVCSRMSARKWNLMIAVGQANAHVDAVLAAATKSGVPTMQAFDGVWTVGTQSPGYPLNYAKLVPSNVVMMSFFPEFLKLAQISSYGLLEDEFYGEEVKLMEQLAPGGSLVLSQFINGDTPDNLMSEFEKSGIKDIILTMKVTEAEKFFTNIQNEGLQEKFRWFLFTPDARPFTCIVCTKAFLWWVRPHHTIRDPTGNPMDALKGWINFELEKFDLLNMETELKLGFYNGMVRMSDDYLHNSNTSNEVQTFNCDSKSSGSDLTAAIQKTPLTYGPLVFDKGLGYQQLIVRVVKIEFYGDTRYVRRIGTWTPNDKYEENYGFNTNISTLIEFTVTTISQAPFVERLETDVDKDKFTYKTATFKGHDYFYRGYCIDLIEKLTKDGDPAEDAETKFTYKLQEVEDGLYGTMNARNEWNGLVQDLITGEAQIALAALSVMAERENYVDFTVPFYDLVGTAILMQKSRQTYNLFRFLKVLELPVWACIIGAYFFTSILLWIFDRFSPYSYSNNKEKYKEDPEKREFTLRECLWFCMTSLTPQGGGEAPKNISGRLVAATWWLFGFIIIASYTANLAAFLTVSRQVDAINSLDDLAKQYRVKYAPARGTSTEVYFRRMAEIEDKFYEIWKSMSLNDSMTPQERAQLAVWDYPVSDKYTSIWRYMQGAGMPASTAEAIDRVYSRPPGDKMEFAYVGDATEIKYATITNCSFRQVGKEFSRKPYALAVQQGSPLKESISKAVLRLLNQRDLERLKENWWTRNVNRVTCPEEDAAAGISIRNIGGVFIVIMAGIALSVITLLFEYVYYRNKRRTDVAIKSPTKEDIGNRY